VYTGTTSAVSGRIGAVILHPNVLLSLRNPQSPTYPALCQTRPRTVVVDGAASCRRGVGLEAKGSDVPIMADSAAVPSDAVLQQVLRAAAAGARAWTEENWRQSDFMLMKTRRTGKQRAHYSLRVKLKQCNYIYIYIHA
jgi:hypothetical protein